MFLYKYEIELPIDSSVPIRYTILGSNDGSSWEYVDQKFLTLSVYKKYVETTDKTVTIFCDINNPRKHSYFRLVISEIKGAPYIKITKWEIVGDPQLDVNPAAETFRNLSRSIDARRPYPHRNYSAITFAGDHTIKSMEVFENDVTNYAITGYISIAIILSLCILYAVRK